MIRRLPAAATALALVLCSCWLPPYDTALNESEALIRKLGAPARSFSVFMRTYDASGGYYLPPRDPSSFTSGFWIVRENGELQVRCVVQDSSTGTYGAGQNGYWSQPDRYGNSSILMPSAADAATLIVYAADSAGFVRLVRNSYGGVSTSGNFVAADPVGAGCAPLSSLSDCYSSVSWTLGVLSVSNNIVGSSETFTNANVVVPSYSASAPSSPAFAALTSASNLFLSAALADGTIGTFVWKAGAFASAPTRLSFITKKIDSVLSDGCLLARTSDGFVVYNPDTKTSFTVMSGTLRFVYERYDAASAAWVCVFTRATAVVSGRSDQKYEYRIEIYELPTVNLSKLAG